MSIQEVKQLEEIFEPYNDPIYKMNLFHNKETGEVIVIVFNPSIVGITKLKDLLTLKAEAIRNLVLYYRTRDHANLIKVVRAFRSYKHNDTL